MFRLRLYGVFHFQCVQAAFAVDHEIHFHFRAGLPVVQPVVAAGIVAPGPKVLGDETLQRGAIDLRRSVQRACRTVGAEDAGVEKEKLRMYRQFAFRPPVENRHPESQQQVLQDFQITGGRPENTSASAAPVADLATLARIWVGFAAACRNAGKKSREGFPVTVCEIGQAIAPPPVRFPALSSDASTYGEQAWVEGPRSVPNHMQKHRLFVKCCI